MAYSTTVTLSDLPLEVHLQILSYLDYPTRLNLSDTNVFFRSIITDKKPSTPEQKLSYLCAAENWSRNKHKFACSRCLRLRVSGAFSDKQLKGRRAKGHAECDRRFCLDCGLKKRIYQAGQKVVVEGHTHYLCAWCSKLCGSGFFCPRCGACQRCIERRHIAQPSSLADLNRSCPRCSAYYECLGWPRASIDIADLVTKLPLALKMAEFEEDFGEVASPEWFEEDIAHGNF